jgi:hypothetical protein
MSRRLKIGIARVRNKIRTEIGVASGGSLLGCSFRSLFEGFLFSSPQGISSADARLHGVRANDQKHHNSYVAR